MPDIRQGIIFGIEIDQSPTRAHLNFKRGVEAVGVACHLESESLEQIAKRVVRDVFFVCKLGVFPDLPYSESVKPGIRSTRTPQVGILRAFLLVCRKSLATLSVAASTSALTCAGEGVDLIAISCQSGTRK